MNPEKLHLALNHFVFLFPLAALVPLVLGLICRNKLTMISGLIIASVGSLLTGVVMGTGEAAYERYQEGPVAVHLDEGAQAALVHHEEVAHKWAKVMYGLLLVTLAALVMAWWKPALLRPMVVAVVVLCVASVAIGVYIADTGGEIRRPDFRTQSQENTANPADPSGDGG